MQLTDRELEEYKLRGKLFCIKMVRDRLPRSEYSLIDIKKLVESETKDMAKPVSRHDDYNAKSVRESQTPAQAMLRDVVRMERTLTLQLLHRIANGTLNEGGDLSIRNLQDFYSRLRESIK